MTTRFSPDPNLALSPESGPITQNAVATLPDQSYLRSGAGILALEAYHAGAVRTLLLQQASQVAAPFSVGVGDVTVVRARNRNSPIERLDVTDLQTEFSTRPLIFTALLEARLVLPVRPCCTF